MNRLDFIDGKYTSPEFTPDVVTSFFRNGLFTFKVASIVIRASHLVKYDVYDSEAWLGSSLETVRLLESLGVKIEISGIDIVERLDGPAVFIGNHMSTLETFVMPLMIQPYRNLVYVVKKSLTTMPFFSDVANSRDPIAVGRENPRDDYKVVMEEGLERISRGKSVVIYPQTTRSADFDPEQMNSIGVKLAKKAGVPVIPVALKTDAWGNGNIIKDLGAIDPTKTVHFKFGEPMDVKGNGKEQHQQIINFISENLKEWQK